MKRSEMKNQLLNTLKSVRNVQQNVITRDLKIHYQNLEVELLKSLCILGKWEPEDE
jgi:hypothetical protein